MTRRLIDSLDDRDGLVMAVAVLSGLLFLQTTTVAQNPGQQLFRRCGGGDGRTSTVVMAVKTLMFEGGGHDFQVDQEFAYDEIGSQFLVYQLRDYKRAYDLANGRGRFEQVREAQATIFNGERPQRTCRHWMATLPSISPTTAMQPASSRRMPGASSISAILSPWSGQLSLRRRR